MLGNDVYAYLDDLIICSKNGDNHLANVEAILLKPEEAELESQTNQS